MRRIATLAALGAGAYAYSKMDKKTKNRIKKKLHL
ncbi:hypothetical protein Bcell_1523 [Evansella cellulosilytica DSM 2522]|uniref:DUF3918 domain-containing protein n=1 Tax=Evansella cellulosilytica (strain ATCC 21833 / DSM 2522 / FERM P-1141 / JCM 9156 / N-4) TaxID=649639 RepID=E6TVA2_EVAC2|nr:hypothetical protein Bcell_1523 [Evansella cellulosilytica DSM 2522]